MTTTVERVIGIKGADIVVHSATGYMARYMGGHGDLVGGIAAGTAQDMLQVRLVGMKNMTGAVMAPPFETPKSATTWRLDAYNYGRRLKTLKGLTPFEYICKIWTIEPDRFTLNPTHQMPGLNT